ncbi:MAG: exonuclease subunit SbcD [Deltaproteobacteria bacterium]|nr:MAG: exonuclease subunit SbcD [Deltaproteobacteria bacterium]
MRIIHTSDWHLGQHFMGKSREEEHRAFLDWLRFFIIQSRADALVVAGDIFDTGTPPSYARGLYNDFIVSLQNTGCAMTVILGGNHDSAATLNESRELLACLNTRVIGNITLDFKDHVLVLKDADGTPGAILCAIPFLRPRDLVTSLAGQSGQDKKQVLVQGISDLYDGVFTAACELRDEMDSSSRLPIIATGHLTIVGGTSSESVREIYIGSLDAFPANQFPPVDYMALGHLHKGQTLKGADHIRYSGSPIPLSFDEGKHAKQILQVDFDDGELKQVESVPIPCFRTLSCIKGNLEQIEKGINELPVPADGRSLWLEVEVATDDYLSDLGNRIQAMIDARDGSRSIELLRIRRRRKAFETGLVSASKEKLEELKPDEVFLRRLAEEEMDNPEKDQLTDLFKEILDQVVQGGLP